MAVAIGCATAQSVAEITDMMTGRGKMPEYIVTSTVPVDLPELVRCKDCKRWARNDGMFKDFDEREWHHCPHLGIDTDGYFSCIEGKRKEK